MVLILLIILLVVSGASHAGTNLNCWWDGRGMQCRHGYGWHERHEWREHEWREEWRRRHEQQEWRQQH